MPTKPRPRIPTTRRKGWHRPEDKWEWLGVLYRWAAPTKPYWHSGARKYRHPDQHGPDDQVQCHSEARRRASLRRIVDGRGK